ADPVDGINEMSECADDELDGQAGMADKFVARRGEGIEGADDISRSGISIPPERHADDAIGPLSAGSEEDEREADGEEERVEREHRPAQFTRMLPGELISGVYGRARLD